jgi:tRNA (guanine37-N1)-methyltransferase
MVMLAEPVLRAVEAVRSSEFGVRSSEAEPRTPNREPRVIMTTPQGRTFNQAVAKELANEKQLILLCGRYEGFDERIREVLQPDEISVGDFVVSGGELPAMIIADATGRMVEGVVGNTGSVEEDSFYKGLLDYPHYTRPEEIRGMRVPDVLLSGHHEKIRRWRREQALRRTLRLRPDLLKNAELDEEAREILREIENETG